MATAITLATSQVVLIIKNMNKIPYEQVFMLLEHEWQKEFNELDVTSINQHCDDMIAIVESCGWNTSDFIRRMMRYSDRS
jgi:hypothetical protein